MQLVKTVKRFVAGSDKYFDIFECTVQEVESYTATSGRSMIKVTVDGKEYKGLHNKWVYEYLCANEGELSFIVLWKAPKGDPMLAYVKEIWQDHINGVDKEVVPEATHEEVYGNDGESFVYMWVATDTDKKYIGKHRGKSDDGYISSSDTFMEEYMANPNRFIRTILAYGTDQEMFELETALLLHLRTRMSASYYNLSNNLNGNPYDSER